MTSDHQTSAEVQREAEAERANLVNTLDQLRENLKPENVVDEVMARAKVNTADLTDRVWQTARDNPIPAVLIGLGAAMLLGLGKTVRSHSAARTEKTPMSPPVRPIVSPGSRGGAPLGAAPLRLTSEVRATADRFSGRWNQLERQTSRAADKISRGASQLRREVQRSAASTATAKSPSVSPTETTMAQLYRSPANVTSSLTKLFDEQPLVLAALGVALGAAVGAAIPSTDTEAQLMGDASASVKNAAQGVARDQYQQLKSTAVHALDDIKQTAADRGLSTDNLSGLVQDVGGKVRDAAYEAGHHAADQLPRSA